MISKKEFIVLVELIKNQSEALSTIANNIYSTHLSFFDNCGEINNIITNLVKIGFIKDEGITDLGKKELMNYKVDNAIILAAGGASGNSKSLYSLPKGLFEVNGEKLIERQIKQLKEAGISDITVVLGYRQELFLYLGEKHNVKLCCTPAIEKGNVITLDSVKFSLKNTYICASDNYYVENPFKEYEYESYHTIMYKDDCVNEVQVKIDENENIIDCFTKGGKGYCFYGHAFINNAYSKELVEYLSSELTVFRNDMLFWEEFAMKYLTKNFMKAQVVQNDLLYEFDHIYEIQGISTLFIDNVSEKIVRKICDVFNCSDRDIKNIIILEKGMTNILFTFEINSKKYIFRYPGESSWQLTNKKREVIAQKLATRIGLDKSCIYIDETGCKICEYRINLKDISELWWNDSALLYKCAKMMKMLHDNTYQIDVNDMQFDAISEGDRLMKLASDRKGNLFDTFEYIRENAINCRNVIKNDDWKPVLCHHDWKYDNILVGENFFDVIDWEYASLDDPGSDLIRLLMGRDFNDDLFDGILDEYFGHKTTKEEKKHIIQSFVPICYYWLGWLMYQESLGNNGFYWTIAYYETAIKAIEYLNSNKN